MTSNAFFAVPWAIAPALLLIAQSPAIAAAPDGAPDGATVFRQRCQSCHSVVPGQPARIGPNLAGVAGRKAAATPFNYSPALKASGIVWNRANLDRFLAAPTRTVPGTRMVMPVTDARQRAAIVDFLTRPAGS